MPRPLEPRFKFLEHITDAEIEAYGATLGEAFENAGLALEELMVDLKSIDSEIKLEANIQAKDREALLYSWLEWLISTEETQGLLFSKFKCEISPWKRGRGYELTAKSWGEKFDPSKHEQKTAVKAPTYHDMEIKEEILEGHSRIKLRFLLDL